MTEVLLEEKSSLILLTHKRLERVKQGVLFLCVCCWEWSRRKAYCWRMLWKVRGHGTGQLVEGTLQFFSLVLLLF